MPLDVITRQSCFTSLRRLHVDLDSKSVWSFYPVEPFDGVLSLKEFEAKSQALRCASLLACLSNLSRICSCGKQKVCVYLLFIYTLLF